MFGILLVSSQPSKQPTSLRIGKTSLAAVEIKAMGKLTSTELWQTMNMPNIMGFPIIHCGNTEMNYIKHSFNHFKAV
jgi:hypothetical protein